MSLAVNHTWLPGTREYLVLVSHEPNVCTILPQGRYLVPGYPKTSLSWLSVIKLLGSKQITGYSKPMKHTYMHSIHAHIAKWCFRLTGHSNICGKPNATSCSFFSENHSSKLEFDDIEINWPSRNRWKFLNV